MFTYLKQNPAFKRYWPVLPALFAIGIALALMVSVAYGQETQVRVGVLALRGPEETMQRWSPTAEYLSARIPGYTFVIVPLNFEEVSPAVRDGEVDFILTNPSIYVELESLCGADRIATLKTLWQGQAYDHFGGVIFSRADRADINTLKDLKGKSFMAVDETSFGGWRMAQREFQKQNITPDNDFFDLQFGGTHDRVVYAVQAGLVDAGTVRTGILEKMAKEGKIEPDDFTILNQQRPDDFLLLLSTQLYPEWPFVKVKHTPNQLAQEVSIALLSMPADSSAAKAASIAGWTIPHNYQPVHECLKYLRVGPYKDLGKIGWADLIGQYWAWILGGIVSVLLAVAITLRVLKLNRELNQTQHALQQARDHLEQRVQERTLELERMSRQNQLVLNAISEGIFGLDRQGRTTFVNPVAQKLLGYTAEELIGKNHHALVHHSKPDGSVYHWKACPICSTLNDGIIQRVAGEVFWRKDGSNFAVEYTSAPMYDKAKKLLGAVVAFSDVTERNYLEEQYRQAQKMEAIGRLAGGVAHDFNNLLTAILGYSKFVLQGLKANDPLRRDVEMIGKAGERAAALTRQLLAFSRQQIIQPQLLNLNVVVADMEKLLRRLIGEDVNLSTQLEEKLALVKADPGQMEQIIMNLAINARDAMPQGGKLTIETANITLDSLAEARLLDVTPGLYVTLTVSDTGHGMDNETQAHIFEPFFTTKEPGKGTGLGLATVFGIIKQCGGHVTVRSKPGQGTTFRIYLRQVEGNVEPIEANDTGIETSRGSETILVVEDEERVRELVRRALLGAGYTVLTACQGVEALQTFQEYNAPIHLLLTDVVMPGGMSGPELAADLSKLNPKMKILFMSGHTKDPIVHYGLGEGRIAFLPKPFTPDVLLRQIRRVLDIPLASNLPEVQI